MYLVREVFKAKPGKAGALVKMFKAAAPHFEKTEGVKNTRIMTDIVTDYWTVVMESDVEDVGAFIKNLRSGTASPELTEIMKGYMDLVAGGHREIYLLE